MMSMPVSVRRRRPDASTARQDDLADVLGRDECSRPAASKSDANFYAERLRGGFGRCWPEAVRCRACRGLEGQDVGAQDAAGGAGVQVDLGADRRRRSRRPGSAGGRAGRGAGWPGRSAGPACVGLPSAPVARTGRDGLRCGQVAAGPWAGATGQSSMTQRRNPVSVLTGARARRSSHSRHVPATASGVTSSPARARGRPGCCGPAPRRGRRRSGCRWPGRRRRRA